MTEPKFPPRITNVQALAPRLIETEYLSLQEHQALIREARARSFEIAAEIISRPLDTKTPHAAVPLLRGRAIQIREGKDE